MYLHLGHDMMVAHGKIVAIIERDIIDRSVETRQFFNRMRATGGVEGPLDGAKSLIILDDRILCSQISTLTLVRRILSDPSL